MGRLGGVSGLKNQAQLDRMRGVPEEGTQMAASLWLQRPWARSPRQSTPSSQVTDGQDRAGSGLLWVAQPARMGKVIQF